ncbi:hypothetical protein [Sphaerisporangium perillae]|uniref:hypothetical protein n=1 Tax=Sphaerisporangium perillae TaxID=2935860 RepID=UPI00200F094E|nr:hypothetical protein [Sphaerisporangium perillae]
MTILAWWLAEVADVAAGVSGECALTFMDGPYEAVMRRDGQACTMTMSGHGEVLRTVEEVRPAAVLDALKDTAAAVLDTCAARGWDAHPDVHRLRAALGRPRPHVRVPKPGRPGDVTALSPGGGRCRARRPRPRSGGR